MPVRREPEVVHDLALEPVGRRMLRRDGREAWPPRVHVSRYAQERRRFSTCPQVVDRESTLRALVAGEEGGETEPGRDRPVGEGRQLAKLRLGRELAGAQLAHRLEAETPSPHVAR